MSDLHEIRGALHRRDLDQARTLLAPFIRSAPNDTSIEELETIAKLAEELGEAAWAETAYNLVLRSDPADEGALSALAALAEENGELENFLPRVQKSVFEGWVPNRRLPALERLLQDGIDLETDMVRIYALCGRCRTAIRGIGCCSEGPAGAEAPDEIIDN